MHRAIQNTPSQFSSNITLLELDVIMSLPLPSSAPPTINNNNNNRFRNLSPREQDEWDAPLIALAQKSNGDLRLLLSCFFSFLCRKTDFYLVPQDSDIVNGVNVCGMGFRNGDAEKMLLATFKQFPLRRMPPRKGSVTKKMESSSSNSSKRTISERSKKGTDGGASTTTTTTSQPMVQKSTSSSTAESTSQATNNTLQTAIPTATESSSTNSKESRSTTPKTSSSSSSCPPTKNEPTIRYTDKGTQIPVGNGGSSTPDSKYTYQWTQTLQEASVAIPLPKDTRAKQLKVVLKPNSAHISLQSNPQDIFFQGDFFEAIHAEESTWSIEGNVLLLILEKKVPSWWESVPKNCPVGETIDTNQVDSRRQLSEYDASTQGMIRKMIFDERQQRLGLPSSDELLIREDLKKHGEDPEEIFGTNEYNRKVFKKPLDKDSILTKDHVPEDLPPGVEFIDDKNFPPEKKNG